MQHSVVAVVAAAEELLVEGAGALVEESGLSDLRHQEVLKAVKYSTIVHFQYLNKSDQ